MNTPQENKSTLQTRWESLGPAQKFIVKSLLSVGIWKLLYTYILHPIRFPDQLLTRIVAIGATFIINLISASKGVVSWMDVKYVGDSGVSLYRNKRIIITVGDTCNGLELMLIYVGVIAFLPGKKETKYAFISIGLLTLILVNMLRCVGLQWIYENYRPYFETTHHYVFTLVMYVIIFIFWVKYLNKLKANA